MNKEEVIKKISDKIAEIVAKYGNDVEANSDKSKEVLSEINKVIDELIPDALRNGVEIGEVIKATAKFFKGFNKVDVDEDGIHLKREFIDDVAISHRYGGPLTLPNYTGSVKSFMDKDNIVRFSIDLLANLIQKKIDAAAENSEVFADKKPGFTKEKVWDSMSELVGINVSNESLELHLVSGMGLTEDVVTNKDAVLTYAKENLACNLIVDFMPIQEISVLAIKVDRKNMTNFGFIVPMKGGEIDIDKRKIEAFTDLKHMALHLMQLTASKDSNKKKKSSMDESWFVTGPNPSDN